MIIFTGSKRAADEDDTIIMIGESGKTTKRVEGSELALTNMSNNKVIAKANDNKFKSKLTIKASHSNSIKKILSTNTPSNNRISKRNWEQLRSNSEMISMLSHSHLVNKNDYSDIAKKYLSYKKLNSNNSDIKIVNEEANECSILK